MRRWTSQRHRSNGLAVLIVMHTGEPPAVITRMLTMGYGAFVLSGFWLQSTSEPNDRGVRQSQWAADLDPGLSFEVEVDAGDALGSGDLLHVRIMASCEKADLEPEREPPWRGPPDVMSEEVRREVEALRRIGGRKR